MLVAQQAIGVGGRQPAHLVDLVRGGELAVERLHHPVADDLGAALVVAVAGRRELVAEPAAQPDLLLDLAQRGVLPALAGVELAFRERPVVVARAVDERDLDPAAAPAPDDAARSLHLGRFRIDRHGGASWHDVDTLSDLLTVDQARRLFSPETTYLNTASYGLPPRPAFEALQAVADEWRHGRTGWHGWDGSVGEARACWARLHGVAPGLVAVGNQVSSFAGLVALSLPRGARVVCARDDFTSVVWPFVVAEGVEVDVVELADVPDAVGPG